MDQQSPSFPSVRKACVDHLSRFDLMICIPIEEFDPFVLLFTLNLSGIMDHNEARRKSTGGKILGFFY